VENTTYGSCNNDLPRLTLLDLLEEFKAQQVARRSRRSSSASGRSFGGASARSSEGASAIVEMVSGPQPQLK
jgi:hypothetical protein